MLSLLKLRNNKILNFFLRIRRKDEKKKKVIVKFEEMFEVYLF